MAETSRFLVVIPTYNAGPYLAQTLVSVRSQTHPDWNAVIVDDASTDGSTVIADRHIRQDRRFHLVKLETNHGAPALPRNRAIRFARENGIPFDFVSFLDGDDLWEPRKLSADLEAFTQDPSLGWVYALKVTHLEGDQRVQVDLPAVRTIKDLAWNNSIYCSSVSLSRAVVDRFSPLFDEDPSLRAIEDTELWFRLLASGVHCKGIDERLTLYRLRESSISHVDRLEALRRLVRLYRTAAHKNPRIPRATFYVPLAYRATKRLAGALVLPLFGKRKIR